MKKITFLKSITFLTALFGMVFSGFGQTTLAEGDIAITGVNTDSFDQFSFVLLTDVTTGTTIHFTDCGWYATGGFRGYNPISQRINEGIVTWEATSDLPCGTQIIIEDIGSDTYSATNGDAIETDPGFNLSGNGDQIIVFQGTTASPVFLFAIHVANNTGWTNTIPGPFGTRYSAVPAGLTDGINAVAFNMDHSTYNCAVTNNQTLILEAIVDNANWSGHNSIPQTLGTCVFTCTAAGSCASTVTWNGSWSGGTPDLTTNVIIDTNYNTNASIGSFRACSLTINNGAILTVDNGTYVEVENNVIVNGELYVETQGDFVQNDIAGIFTNNGISRVNKQTAVKSDWFHYTYWSSPVENETTDNVFGNVDGDRRFWFNAANFVDNVGNDDIDDNGDDWQYALASNGTNNMIPGVGYAVTEARFFVPGSAGTASFEGEFNTGNIEVDIELNPSNTGVNWNFIGNPYPSAIDFIAFQAANSSVIDGAAYFWSQAAPPSAANAGNEVLNFDLNDYAVFTVGSGAISAGGVSTEIPTGYIASAQGFFIPALSVGKATFTNAMRMADGASNNQFFKGTSSKNSNSTIANKLWINLTSGNGIFNQVLISYVDGATDGNDGMYYDAPKFASANSAAMLYTFIDAENTKYAIQGKSINSINENEIINIGFNTNVNVSTIFNLSVAQLQGDFLNNNTIYLKDNLLNITHNLSDTDYNFTSETGAFTNRFEIVFKEENTLAVDALVNNESAFQIIQHDSEQVTFKTGTSATIKTIVIYDLFGRKVYQFTGENSSETYNIPNIKTGIYIAKAELSTGTVITKKAIKR
ncbi:T9SS type A sorting domain-containing protein [Algibacter miyuki]|uniref:T9SS type A sorting domain-containing protein n=1 Tax=Algibacter miyuki TaxID=1306933 RepID=A0ABV5GV02_9FLAO|nr:T9SS type A sorting domain-containing protein [Algibacter miyuki]MDN3664792.1 T9SS type A sorting domain-containing protein [Algibacter miyuki]